MCLWIFAPEEDHFWWKRIGVIFIWKSFFFVTFFCNKYRVCNPSLESLFMLLWSLSWGGSFGFAPQVNLLGVLLLTLYVYVFIH